MFYIGPRLFPATTTWKDLLVWISKFTTINQISSYILALYYFVPNGKICSFKRKNFEKAVRH